MSEVRKIKTVLSIDGGGIRGIIPAMILAEIERQTGKRIAECFDLIVGTSTGGIIALGLTMPNADASGNPQYKAQDMVGLYQDNGDEIFDINQLRKTLRNIAARISDMLGKPFERPYKHEEFEKLLLEKFGDYQLKNALTNTCITSYDLDAEKPLFFKSYVYDQQKKVIIPNPDYGGCLAREIARATSAAPTYFFPKQMQVQDAGKNRDVTLVDGGVCINSPSVSAYVEAKKIFPDEEIFVVSLGSGEFRSKYTKINKDVPSILMVDQLLDCMFDGVSDVADYQMRLLLPEDNYIRIQPKLTNKDMAEMDNVSDNNIVALEKLAKDTIKITAATDIANVISKLK